MGTAVYLCGVQAGTHAAAAHALGKASVFSVHHSCVSCEPDTGWSLVPGDIAAESAVLVPWSDDTARDIRERRCHHPGCSKDAFNGRSTTGES